MTKRKKTRIPGYWTTRELAEYRGVQPAAILMHVHRGKLTPVPPSRERERHLFTDAEVERYLAARKR
jgi:hypothetical protein